MDRLQKKCVIVSASMHGLLASALLFGSAFLAPPGKSSDLDVLTVIPDTLVDSPFSNPGGNPNVKQPPPVAPPVVVQPPPLSQPLKQESVAKPPEPTPSKPAPQKTTDEPDPTKPSSGKHVIVNPKMVVRKSDPNAKNTKDDSEAEAKAQAKAVTEARRKAVAGALAGIGSVLSGSTSVEISGPGGKAYASYTQAIKTVYQKRYELALLSAGDISEGYAEVAVSITIKRDGSVLSTRIVTGSNNQRLNQLVQRVLDSIREIAPFPEGSKDPQRTFDLIFDLKSKNDLG